ncbi:MurR/RpiR family transcriptional regulator [Enterococcus faecalis]|uniref:MurR/RpiR family transcriptional regulator n=1 Tax=Enterococcus faecalis TaxID=1351 RepID=UPI001144B067|nr:MurR/RpiR family transcriptional regulator [Enterococcus faecalis]NSW10292.1 MurR/RpiR family transcriptional regulator [Enterococcus faecalis]TQB30334.1 MurR/RpiR family transcriptional regulator [Enterococcus faecalis]
MSTLIERKMNKAKVTFNSNEMDILKVLNERIEDIPKNSINQLAKQTFTSVSTLHRTIKKLGFSGFSEFKFQIADSLENSKKIVLSTENYLDNTINEITITHKINEKEIKEVAKKIVNTKNRYCYGTGWKQKQLVDNFSNDLIYYGETFTTLRTKHDLFQAANYMKKGSLLFIVSAYGEPFKYVQAINQLKLKEVTLITATVDQTNSLSKYSDHSLFYKDYSLETEGGQWAAITLNYLLNLLIHEIAHINDY